MAATILQRNFQSSKNSEKGFVIEMNEAPAEGIAFHTSLPLQPNEVPYTQSQVQGPSQLQASVLSLASISCMEHSDVQPLTESYPCRYDDCMNYHNVKTDKEAEENPVSPLKNVLLYLVIVLFVLWIIIYTALTQLKVI